MRKINWLYAIGEIIIVIIGITVAFGLNTWAESSRQQSVKEEYLQSLHSDLQGEIAHLEENIVAFQKKLESVKTVMPYLNGRQEGRAKVIGQIFGLAEIIHFRPNDISFKTLINSGDLGLFHDISFKKELEEYYAKHSLIEMDYLRQTKINEKYFGDFMIYEMDYTKLQRGDFDFMDNKLLQNIVQSLFGTYQICITSSEQGIDRSKAMMSLIETRLND